MSGEQGIIPTVTTIDSLDDFLRALDANPSWREAVRTRILGEELLQLPVKFEAFVQEQRTSHANIDARLDRIEGDTGTLKRDFARTRTIQDTQDMASDMGLEFVWTLSARDLSHMARNGLPRDIHRSFRNADLVIEATDGEDAHYIAMEISFTADRRDCDRAIRNARLITRFTEKPTQAAIASVRNDRDATEAVESGAVYSHPLEDRTPSPE